VIKNEVRIFNFKDRTEISIFRSFCAHNVAKETCARTDYTDLLTEFYGVQEGRIQHTDLGILM